MTGQELNTGFTELDGRMGDIKRCGLYFVTGRDPHLCSVFLVNIACFLADRHRVLYLLEGNLSVAKRRDMLRKRASRGGRVQSSRVPDVVFKKMLSGKDQTCVRAEQYKPDILILELSEEGPFDIPQLKQFALCPDVPVIAKVPWKKAPEAIASGEADVSICMSTADKDSVVTLGVFMHPEAALKKGIDRTTKKAVSPKGMYFDFRLKYLPECCVLANIPDSGRCRQERSS